MRSLYTRAIYEDPAATLDDLREAVNMLEDAGRTARRVLGGAHPITTVTAVKPAESPTYGFVRPDAGGDDVFVAFGDVVRGTLAAGDRVEYELVPNEVRGDGVKGGNVVVLPARTPAAAPAPRSVPADARTAALEAENEGLRDENARLTGEVSKLRRALRHAANMIDALGGAPSGDVGVDS